jgi:hypothetical protein
MPEDTDKHVPRFGLDVAENHLLGPAGVGRRLFPPVQNFKLEIEKLPEILDHVGQASAFFPQAGRRRDEDTDWIQDFHYWFSRPVQYTPNGLFLDSEYWGFSSKSLRTRNLEHFSTAAKLPKEATLAPAVPRTYLDR